MEVKEILSKCDHTLLAQTATWKEIRAICDDGMKYGCASVCIPASYVKQAAEYAAENNARLELYTNGEPEITITPLSVEPYLLYIDDVTNEGDRGYWLNLALMDYYGKDRITVSGPEE